MRIDCFPENKKHFTKLLEFGKEILEVCAEVKIKPILYGSLACFAFLKDNKMKVNDIDFLIREKDFPKLIKKFSELKIKHSYSEEWHVLQVFSGKMKIEFDSRDFWQKSLKEEYIEMDFGRFKTKAVSLKSLKGIYKRASKLSKDNPEGNRKKFEMLDALKKDF